MSKRRTLEEQIEQAQKEQAQKEARVKELLSRKRTQDDKARTHRLCRRGGYLESNLPELITITDDQFHIFVEKALLSEFARKILKGFADGGNAHQSNSTTVPESVPNNTNTDSNQNNHQNHTHNGGNTHNRSD